MGDRGNVLVTGRGAGIVYLYTHWGGAGLLETVRSALVRRERWDDGQYLARIVFCEMLGTADEPLIGTTGFGISSEIGDNEHPVIVIDTVMQVIGLARQGEEPETYLSQPLGEFITGPGPLDAAWNEDEEE